MGRAATGWLAAGLAAACASSPAQAPIAVRPIAPAEGEQVGVDDVLYVLDASRSMSGRTDLASEKQLLRALASAMPEGDYGAGLLVFGGGDRQREEIAAFRRTELQTRISRVQRLGGDTRLAAAIDEVGAMLPGGPGRRAVLLISDGVAKEGADGVLRATDRLLASRSDELCLHTIGVGDHPGGASLLRALAAKTPCGSYRTAGELETASAVQRLGRDAFLVAAAPAARALPAVAARPPGGLDADHDGVGDDLDRCQGTPFGVVVDARGCWQTPTLLFDTNSSILSRAVEEQLGELSGVLERNPAVSIRVLGHADITGEPGYNVWLAERRARRVRDYLVGTGIDAGRVAIEAVGDGRPLAPNDDAQGRARNRRAEIVVER